MCVDRAQRDAFGQRPAGVARRHEASVYFDAAERDVGVGVGITDAAAEPLQAVANRILAQVVEVDLVLPLSRALEQLGERSADGEHVEQAPVPLCVGELGMLTGGVRTS